MSIWFIFMFICSVIEWIGWQKFCEPPLATAMTIVREFYANANEEIGTVTMA